MGNVRRIGKKMSPKLALADTHIVINGCKVFLGHLNGSRAVSSAKKFNGFLGITLFRSKCVNLHDLYGQSFLMREKILNGEPIWN